MNYYRRYMADYGAKTAALSLAEHGAYNLLLDICYSTEKPLPGPYEALYRLCRAMTKVEQDAVKSVADSFFPKRHDGTRSNPRADDEIAKAQATIAKQRESGVESAARRWSTDGSTHAASIQPPTTNLQPLTTKTSSSKPEPKQKPSAASRRPAGDTVPVWSAYQGAYKRRYSVEPTRNAKVNGMLGKFLERVPVAEAPDIAAFYVGHSKGLYVSSKHCIDLLLRDAEGLRTEWLSGRPVTDTEARQADRTQATGAAFNELIREAEERERTTV